MIKTRHSRIKSYNLCQDCFHELGAAAGSETTFSECTASPSAFCSSPRNISYTERLPMPLLLPLDYEFSPLAEH